MILPSLQVAYDHIPESAKDAVTGASIAGALSAVFGFITGLFGAIGAILSALWLLIRVYETKTVQTWLARQRS